MTEGAPKRSGESNEKALAFKALFGAVFNALVEDIVGQVLGPPASKSVLP